MKSSYWIAAAAAVIVLVLALMWATPDDDMVVADPGTDVVTPDETELAGGDTGAGADAATDETTEEIAEGDAANLEVADENLDMAAEEGVADTPALQPETFDMDEVIAVIEGSQLPESEQDAFVVALDNAANDPGQLAIVLEDLRVALAEVQ